MLPSDNRLVSVSSTPSNLDRPLHDFAHAPSSSVSPIPAASASLLEQAHLRDYLNIVLKRKWLILSIVVVITSLVAIYMYRQPSTYQTATTLQIDAKPRSLLKTTEISINSGNDATYRNTQLKLLENPTLLRQVILTLDLQNNPAFLNSQGAGLLTTVRQVFARKPETVSDNEGLAVANENSSGSNVVAVSGTPLTPEQLARLEPYEDAMLAALTIEPIERTNLVEIRFSHTDPVMAMNVANTLAQVFIANDVRRETAGSENQEAVLARQITDLQLQIRQLEAQRINYMKNNDIPLSDMKGQNVIAVRLETTSAQSLAAEKERKDLQAAYNAAQSSQDIMSIPQVQGDRSIQGMRDRISVLEEQRAALLVQYTEAYPAVKKIDEQIAQVKRDINRTARQVVASLKSQLDAATAKDAQLRNAYAQERSAAGRQSQAEILLSSLNQQLETSKQLYNTAYQRQKEVQVTSGDRTQNITIQTPAREPRDPVGPMRGRNIFIALLLSLGAGIGLAILLDNLDDTLKSIADVDRYIHLPTLGLIPAPRGERGRLRGKGRASGTELQPASGAQSSALILIEDARSPVAEAYRHLRTSLLLSSAGQPPKTVLVTSSQPSEGKTTTAVNTAVTLAQTGADVLLLDCDLRRPRIHTQFGLANGRGLTNYLAGEATLDEIIQSYPKLPNLKILASGPVPPNPAELLGSEEMRRLLSELSDRFTHVIIDSPPAISFTDAAILSTIVDGVMLVVYGGHSSRAIVRRARQQLLDVGAHIYGVVLNNVKLESSDYNYYAGYYASYYEEMSDADEQAEETIGDSRAR